ncbi:hypothetical protein TIFTF001_010624 [Ficus carica]|uniref:Subtilisin-like protease fibronectin type-III domain-containing protein n=1 Tax=Ficus carica TaxID=3494 RepID=A0AA87ZS19_FICCA|nr:hypothetical protein TIFTF001_010624 [Ficus carica]
MALTWFFFLILVITSTLLNGHSSAAQDDRKIYIVYMGDSTKDEVSMSQLHANMLQKVVGRTVTNVGSPASTYKANLVAPPGIKITVNPSVLSFTSLGEKLSYAVTVQGTVGKKLVVSASLVWDDGSCQVRSPIIVYIPT